MGNSSNFDFLGDKQNRNQRGGERHLGLLSTTTVLVRLDLSADMKRARTCFVSGMRSKGHFADFREKR